ncbi:hypothetical protein CEXT_273451 [Caerostris extrusa]|uniref:Uncharacterized protein n=1 Tax=Caerostris extrusa TaxID=172846 RepID=A0AAV4PV76_CAEEX|nr:hypothetical protein CEXT_273451 [Caerostris extrusa]
MVMTEQLHEDTKSWYKYDQSASEEKEKKKILSLFFLCSFYPPRAPHLTEAIQKSLLHPSAALLKVQTTIFNKNSGVLSIELFKTQHDNRQACVQLFYLQCIQCCEDKKEIKKTNTS